MLLATVSRKCFPSPTDWCVNRLPLVFIYCVVVEGKIVEKEGGKVEQDEFKGGKQIASLCLCVFVYV